MPTVYQDLGEWCMQPTVRIHFQAVIVFGVFHIFLTTAGSVLKMAPHLYGCY